MVTQQGFARATAFGRASAVAEKPPVFDEPLPDFGFSVQDDDTGATGFHPFAFPFTSMNLNLKVTLGYRALHEQAAWFDLSARGRIRVTGEDRARLLHAMATQNIQELKPGEGCYAFFLNAQGRILCDAQILCFEDHFLLDTEPETRPKLFEHLDRYIIADDVTLEDVTESLAEIAIEGPAAEGALKKIGAPAPQRDHAVMIWGENAVVRITATGAGGFRVLTPAPGKAALLQQLQIPEASADDVRLVRIEHGVPRYGEEISERYLVQETAQLQAVNFSKGCYLGQEIVERVRSRAQIHRILRALQIETNDIPATGTKLKAGEADAGEIASAAYSPGLEKVVAMAYLKMPFTEPGTQLRLGDALVRVS